MARHWGLIVEIVEIACSKRAEVTWREFFHKLVHARERAFSYLRLFILSRQNQQKGNFNN